ncbi:MAG TPA: hypothetical protein VIY48_04840 [Candidatus Paceibacterota bacterium]
MADDGIEAGGDIINPLVQGLKSAALFGHRQVYLHKFSYRALKGTDAVRQNKHV